MKLNTLAVHAGDRKKLGNFVPVTTPIYSATSFFYDSLEELDRVFADEDPGENYSRYGNPTARAFEAQVAALEGGEVAFSTSSGMAALHLALLAALTDRRRSIVAANALYGQTLTLLTKVLEPSGVAVRFADPCDPVAFEAAVAEAKPACVLVETVSNPLLRVAPIDKLSEIAHRHGAFLLVDATFSTPVLLRPLEHGADMVIHSATKFLAGHGDVLGGVVIAREEFQAVLQSLARTLGPNLGPFESYLAMRGVKTLALRMERHCRNAARVAGWLGEQAGVSAVHYPGDPRHPDAETVARLLPHGMHGAMVSFELRGAGRDEVFRFLDALKLVVRATSLGDVHSMILYPVMSSHRDLAPKHRERLGITDSLVRVSVGIEAIDDIIADLAQAMATMGPLEAPVAVGSQAR
jgi:cystathionine gamma-synthase/methionine-gamma-lyase